MSTFEIVTRTDFSAETYLLEVRHPQMAKAVESRQVATIRSGKPRDPNDAGLPDLLARAQALC